MNKEGFIYCYTNKINNKKYIGKTTDLKRRKRVHENEKNGFAFHRAIRKYGIDNFIFEIIEDKIFENTKLNEREKYWISFYNSNNCLFGYNLTSGGDGVDFSVKETKIKHDNAMRSEKRIGKFLDYMKKNKVSWRKSFEEGINTEDCIRKRNIARELAVKAISKSVMCIETGEVFNTIKEAGIKMNINNVCICHALNGRSKTAGKFHWKYMEKKK